MHLPKKFSLTSQWTVIYRIRDQEISDATSCANFKSDLDLIFRWAGSSNARSYQFNIFCMAVYNIHIPSMAVDGGINNL